MDVKLGRPLGARTDAGENDRKTSPLLPKLIIYLYINWEDGLFQETTNKQAVEHTFPLRMPYL